MKTRLLFLLFFMAILSISEAQVSINNEGTDPNESAMLDISSTDKGLLIPRMSSVQRQQIENPANGLMVFDETTNTFWFYSEINNNWEEMGGAIVNVLNDLLDAKTDANSIYIGAQTAVNDDGDNMNTVIGNQALKDNLSGNSNTALGAAAAKENTSGSENVAIGLGALANNKTGDNNTALGFGANGFYNSQGSNNVALGSRALLMNSGSENTAIGKGAGQNSFSSGSGNIFIGFEAGKEEEGSNKLYIENSSSTTPLIGGDFEADQVDINGDLNVNGNIKISGGNPGEGKVLTSDENGNASWTEANNGAQTIGQLADAKTNGKTLYMGDEAGDNDNQNTESTGVGYQSLLNNSGLYNNAFGYGSMLSNSDGYDNTAFGRIAMSGNTSGDRNVGFGNGTLNLNKTGNNNTAIGAYAGAGTSDDISGSVFIGQSAGYNETESNKLYIENSSSSTPLIGGDFSTDEVVINGTLQITGGAPGEGKVLVSDADGKASWSDAAGAQNLNQLSDAKTNDESIFIGELSGDSHTIGYDNTALGYASLKSNSNGFSNTAFGKSAMEENSAGYDNVAVGKNSLKSNIGGDKNTIIGAYAGASTSDNIGGSVFIGYSAGKNETESNKLYIENSSSSTPLIGGDFFTDEVVINGTLQITGGNPASGKVLVSDSQGKASWSDGEGILGIDDLNDAKHNGSNLYIGNGGTADFGANKNTAVGHSALNSNNTGQHNVAFGYSSLLGNTSGSDNTALGYSAMEISTNGFKNTAVGSGALYYSDGAGHNTAIGFEAGFGAPGSNSAGNVFIGYKAGYYETGSNKLYISNSDTDYPLVYGDFAQSKLEVNGEFKVTEGAYSNVKINNTKLESNVPIDAKSSLDVDGEFTANDKIIANDNIEAHEDIILSDEKNITYENARTAKVNYAGTEFYWSTLEEDDYSYSSYHDGTTLVINTLPYSGRTYFNLSKQIQLPEGAKITNIKFSFGGGPDDEVQIQIIKRSFEQTYVEGDELFESTLHFGESEWMTYEFGFSVDPIIDNDYIYQICLRAQVNDNDSFGGIFGLNTVRVEYEYETLNH
jgi:phage baseplate assembly protein gpV